MQHNSNNNFTPYDEFLALRNQVEELVKSAKNKDLDEMKEKIEILEKEKRKISDENITLKRELIKLQDLLASHRRIPREDQSIPNIAIKNRPNQDFFLTKEQSKRNSDFLSRTMETQYRSRPAQSPIEMDTMLHKTSNTQNWSFPRVSTTRNFVSEKPSFESRNRFQCLSDLSASRDGTYAGAAAIDPYAGVAVTAPYAGVATTNTRQDLDTKREEKRNQQRDRNFNPKKKVVIIGDSMLKQIKRQDINYHFHDTIAHVKIFPGATSEDMKSYIEPTLKSKPDEVILHCGTNDLRNEEPQEIAEKIAEIAQGIQAREQKVTVSGLIRRANSPELEWKRRAVNVFLLEKLRGSQIGL